jgi:hypothetical protein
MSNAPQAFVLSPSKSYDDCIDECERLGLIERMSHGDNDYIRFTQLGHNVLAAMAAIAGDVDLDEPFQVS